MKEFLRKYFVPHGGNEYKPHFLRERTVFLLTLVALFAFSLSLLHRTVITKTDLAADILSSVLLDLANEDRLTYNASPLLLNPLLEEAARRKAGDMAAKGYFAHTSPEGLTPWHWFETVGYRFAYAGENLAVNFSDSEDVNRAWMDSPGHRDNILNKSFTEVGIAAARGVFQESETTFVVQMFGRPAEAASAPLEEPKQKEEIVLRRTEEQPRQIAGAEASEASLYEGRSKLETIFANDMFIAVKNVETEAPEPGIQEVSPPVSYASWIERLVAAPNATFTYVYAALALLVAVALLLMIFIEFEVQHPNHILYGMFLLLLLASLVYVSEELIAGGVLVL